MSCNGSYLMRKFSRVDWFDDVGLAPGSESFFAWEPVWGVDAWVALTAAAMTTSRIRLGTMLTPLPRRRPWDLAGQTAALPAVADVELKPGAAETVHVYELPAAKRGD